MEIRLGTWRLTVEKLDPQEDVLGIILKPHATEQEIEVARRKALGQKLRIAIVE